MSPQYTAEIFHPSGFSLGLDDMEGDLPPPYGGDKAVIGGDIYFMGGPILRIVFNPKWLSILCDSSIVSRL